MKRFSTLLATREIQFKAKVRYYFKATRMTLPPPKKKAVISVGWGYKDVEELESSYLAGDNVK